MEMLIFLALIGVLTSVYGLLRIECPREIIGYRCHGNTCDHSGPTRSKALEDMRKLPYGK